MSDHFCEAVIVTCIDFRFQEYINSWISQNFHPKSYDRVAFAEGVHDLEAILKQIEVSQKLHHIKKVVFINHEDCGAYGKEGTDKRHHEDLKNAAQKVKEKFPDLEVETYYLHLGGTFEEIT
ncbi:MAG: hypothetical protein Q7S44_01045 [bacterium]|nr:hypothetical protein [bacterium]